MRAFAAIPLPHPILGSLETLKQAFQPSVGGIRWVGLNQMHITLKFFGEISEQSLIPIADCLRQASQKQAPFIISLAELGGFPSLDLPRVLWVGVGKGAAFVATLAQAIERECRRLGLRSEARAYHPHVTLARIETSQASRQIGMQAKAVSWAPVQEWKAEKLVFYQSTLAADGPRYQVLEEFALSA